MENSDTIMVSGNPLCLSTGILIVLLLLLLLVLLLLLLNHHVPLCRSSQECLGENFQTVSLLLIDAIVENSLLVHNTIRRPLANKRNRLGPQTRPCFVRIKGLPVRVPHEEAEALPVTFKGLN